MVDTEALMAATMQLLDKLEVAYNTMCQLSSKCGQLTDFSNIIGTGGRLRT